jgi:prevent-host-death family protein
MNTTTVTVRELQRNQKDVIERVKKTKQPAVVVNQDEPQVILMPLDAAREFERLQRKEALERLLAFSEEMAVKYKDKPIPTDLSVNHDKYFAEVWEEQHTARTH